VKGIQFMTEVLSANYSFCSWTGTPRSRLTRTGAGKSSLRITNQSNDYPDSEIIGKAIYPLDIVC
jgi:hypothetical protein